MMVGDMRHRIAFLEEETTTDASGFTSKDWIETKRTWAKVSKNIQAENETANKIMQEDRLIFTVRYQSIDTKSRIAFGGKQYLIDTIGDPEFSKRYLDIIAREVK